MSVTPAPSTTAPRPKMRDDVDTIDNVRAMKAFMQKFHEHEADMQKRLHQMKDTGERIRKVRERYQRVELATNIQSIFEQNRRDGTSTGIVGVDLAGGAAGLVGQVASQRSPREREG